MPQQPPPAPSFLDIIVGGKIMIDEDDEYLDPNNEEDRRWLQRHRQGALRNYRQALAGGNPVLVARIACELKYYHDIIVRIPGTKSVQAEHKPIRWIRGY